MTKRCGIKILLTVELHKLYGQYRAKDILRNRKEIAIEDNKNYIIYNRDIYKRYKDTSYYVDINGNIYSTFCNRIINPLKRNVKGKIYYYIDIFDSEQHKQKHTPIHKIVYEAWVDKIKSNQQVNHKDDNSENNTLSNLYVGSQQENINDCFDNKHRVGNVFKLTLYDNEKDKIITFCPASDFIEYSGHTNKSGSLQKFFTKQWFEKRYKIINYERINNLEEYQGVTTMGDECSPVE